MSSEYKNFAFISYSHRDMAVAKWFQSNLEAYRLPTEIRNEFDARSRYLRPVFRDETDLNGGILNDQLRQHLRESKFLIVICSKNSVQSDWVNAEAQAFIDMGRLDRIIPIVIPNGDRLEKELFPKCLRDYIAAHPDRDLLGHNIGILGKEKVLIRVVSLMLGISFDTLWRRHLRQKRIRILTVGGLSVMAAAAAYLFAVPVEVNVGMRLEPSELPLGPEVKLNVDGADYFSDTANPEFGAIVVPGYKRFSSIDIHAESRYFKPLDTTVRTGFGVRRDVGLTLRRDDSFAIFSGEVYDPDMNPLEGATVEVCGISSTTDAGGRFDILLPLSLQRAEQTVSIRKAGYRTIRRDDESPSGNIKFILHPDQ